MLIEKNGDVDYHDKLCYYLVHAMKRHGEFGLLHDRMLNEKRRNESNLLKFFWVAKRICFCYIKHIVCNGLLFDYFLCHILFDLYPKYCLKLVSHKHSNNKLQYDINEIYRQKYCDVLATPKSKR